jgi:hypothetical protein
LIESLARASSKLGRGIRRSARHCLTSAIGLLAHLELLPFCGRSITLRPRIRRLASRSRLPSRLSTASAIAIAVAWLCAPFTATSATLSLSSTATTAVTAALVSASG